MSEIGSVTLLFLRFGGVVRVSCVSGLISSFHKWNILTFRLTATLLA